MRKKVKVKIGTNQPQHEGKVGVVLCKVIGGEIKIRFPGNTVAYFNEDELEEVV